MHGWVVQAEMIAAAKKENVELNGPAAGAFPMAQIYVWLLWVKSPWEAIKLCFSLSCEQENELRKAECGIAFKLTHLKAQGTIVYS